MMSETEATYKVKIIHCTWTTQRRFITRPVWVTNGTGTGIWTKFIQCFQETIDWFLWHSTKMGHFRDVLPTQLLSMVLKKN